MTVTDSNGLSTNSTMEVMVFAINNPPEVLGLVHHDVREHNSSAVFQNVTIVDWDSDECSGSLNVTVACERGGFVIFGTNTRKVHHADPNNRASTTNSVS